VSCTLVMVENGSELTGQYCKKAKAILEKEGDLKDIE